MPSRSLTKAAHTRGSSASTVGHLNRHLYERLRNQILSGHEDGLALTLSPLPQGEAMKYPTGFHIGFNLDNEHELIEVHERIVSAGVPIVRALGDLAGALTFHCTD